MNPKWKTTILVISAAALKAIAAIPAVQDKVPGLGNVTEDDLVKVLDAVAAMLGFFALVTTKMGIHKHIEESTGTTYSKDKKYPDDEPTVSTKY